MSEFKKGDVVVLKSGGPKMTVSDVANYSGMSAGPQDGVECVWFETVRGSKKSNTQVFDSAVLDHYKPAAPFMVV